MICRFCGHECKPVSTGIITKFGKQCPNSPSKKHSLQWELTDITLKSQNCPANFFFRISRKVLAGKRLRRNGKQLFRLSQPIPLLDKNPFP